jgi:hypothetical protein
MNAIRDTASTWQDLLKHPSAGDHLVQLYQDDDFLGDAVAEYVAAGLRAGDAAVLIVTPAHRELFLERLTAEGVYAEEAIKRGQLRVMDAAQTLALFMRAGAPEWQAFHQHVGGALAELRCQYPRVRAYGEMVDVLWRDGMRDAALRLEEFWNKLAGLQTFSLLCGYYMDNLDSAAYDGPLDCVCKVHTHLIPARDYSELNDAVAAASKQVLDQPLAQMLLSLSASHRPLTQMPLGQATLLWLKKNMPRTADKVLSRVRAQLG